MLDRAYFDYAATSPMGESVRNTFAQALCTLGNAASTHSHGQAARELLEEARERIAAHFGITSPEIIFTSGGTESINLAIKGAYWKANPEIANGNIAKPVLIINGAEHHATIEAAEWLSKTQGAELRVLPVDRLGILQAETLERAIEEIGAERIACVSFLWANNEIGAVQPVEELLVVCERAGVLCHVDAVAALGQVDMRAVSARPQLLSVSAHKIGGPVGTGALIVRRDCEIEALVHGGGQQRMRSGTQDVPAALAFAQALEENAYTPERIRALARARDRLIHIVRETDPTAQLQGPPAVASASPQRLPSNAHFIFPGCQSDSLLFLLDQAGVSVSAGAACTAGVAKLSHVLLATGLTEEQAAGALRFTVGTETRDRELDLLARALPQAVARSRAAGLNS